MKNAPCLNCPERHGGCWAGCEKYLHFREERDRENAEKAKLWEKDRMVDSFRLKRGWRNKKIREAYK